MLRLTVLTAAAIGVATILAAHPAARAQSDHAAATATERAPVVAPNAKPIGHANATPEQLKSIYLNCSRAAMTTPLDFGTTASCSLVYEELKQRVFGGDFHRLLAWSRQQPTVAVAPAGAERQ